MVRGRRRFPRIRDAILGTPVGGEKNERSNVEQIRHENSLGTLLGSVTFSALAGYSQWDGCTHWLAEKCAWLWLLLAKTLEGNTLVQLTRATEAAFRSHVGAKYFQALPADGEHWLKVVIGCAPLVNPLKDTKSPLLTKRAQEWIL